MNFFFYLEYDVFKLLEESARLKRSLDADWYNFEEESTEIFLDVLDADIWSTDKYFLKWIGKLNELYIAKLVADIFQNQIFVMIMINILEYNGGEKRLKIFLSQNCFNYH